LFLSPRIAEDGHASDQDDFFRPPVDPEGPRGRSRRAAGGAGFCREGLPAQLTGSAAAIATDKAY